MLRAEPVDIRSGSVVVAYEDFAIPGRLPLAWPREYRSDNAYSGASGHGWETPADIRLEIDAAGRRVERRSSGGNHICVDYDPAGQPRSIRINEAAPVSIERDALGRAVTERLGTELERTLSYDAAGFLSAQHVKAAHRPLFDTGFQHDLAGNLTERRDSRWGTDRYRHDASGQLRECVDPLGQVYDSLADAAGDTLRTRVVELAAQRVVGGETDGASSWIRVGEASGLRHAYDRAGNLIERTDLRQPDQPRLRFGWDAHQRLQESHWVTGPRAGQSTAYGYDPAGRRVFKRNPYTTTWYFWDGDTLLGEATVPNEVSPVEVDPPAAGNVYDLQRARRRLSQLKGLHSRIREYVYWPDSFEPLAWVEGAAGTADGAGSSGNGPPPSRADELPTAVPQPTPASPPPGSQALGQLGTLLLEPRAPSTGTGQGRAAVASTKARLDGGFRLGAASLSPSPSATPVAAAGPARPKQPVPAAARGLAPRGLAYFHNDVNGAPMRVTDPSGRLLWEAHAGPWGEVTAFDAQEVNNPLRLQGQYADDETGLHYNRYRYYDPRLGRYVSQDPLGLKPSLNLYAYALNASRWSDPLGLTCAPVHGNSRLSTRPNHVYVIVDTRTGRLMKPGISGAPLLRSGASPRANRQLSKLNAKHPNRYKAVIVESNVPRTRALDIEQLITDRHAARNAGAMPSSVHKRPKPQVQDIDDFRDEWGFEHNRSMVGRY